MASRISKNIGSCILLTLLAISTMCLCSSCTCCYCTTICHCENGDYTFDPYFGVNGGPTPCDNNAKCTQACADQKLGSLKSYNPNGFGCYESDCTSPSN